MYKHLSVLIALIIGSAGAFALGSPDAQLAKSQRRTDQIIAALSQMNDADSLAAAGLMSIGNHTDESLSLIARAVGVAPDRADLVWLHAQRCSQLPPCDPEPIEHHLREIDPSNGTGWFGALARASVAENDADIDAALARIGQSERVDIYWTTLIAHLTRAAAHTRKISLEDAEISITGYLAAEAIPAYHHVANACKGERLQHPKTLDDCRGVANSFQRGDNLITEMIGVSIAKRVWPEDSPEWKAAVEARRVYDYRAKFIAELDLRGERQAKEYLTLCAQHRREQDVFVAQMIAAGVNPNPPVQ
jgi:hypothetical protein